MVRIFASSLVLAAGLAGAAGPAAALVVTGSGNVAMAVQAPCAAPAAVFGSLVKPSAAPGPRMSKATAILGVQMSALERMQQEQQARFSAPSASFAPIAAAPLASTIAGAIAGSGAGAAGSNRFALPAPSPAAPSAGVKPIGDGDFLLTRRLPVSRTAFDAQWSRVSRATLAPSAIHRLLPAELRGGAADLGAVERVNAWANHRVRYVEDAKLFGRADYWADAGSTLRRRAGDCEDIAIAKMQLLAGIGVPRSDMVLTIARDLVRHADHALLLVHVSGRYWVLDNATDRLLDANGSLDYQPVLSFSGERKWLHGAVQFAAN
jgi:predicted transglutaminase-like cysteine proteinase